MKRNRNRLCLKRWLIAILVVAGLVLLWTEYLEDRLVPRRWGVVEPGLLYRSGQLHPSLVERTLKRHGIEVIVDLTEVRPDDPAEQAEATAASEMGIEREVYPLVGDGTGDPQQYVKALTTLCQSTGEGRRTLVHCAAGSQRTGGAVALYELLVKGMPVDRVRREMEAYDWDPKKDAILTRYLNEHMAEIADGLVAAGVLDRPPDPLPVLP